MHHTYPFVQPSAELAQLQAAIATLLQQLPQLSLLQLSGYDVGPDAVQHLSAMTRLQVRSQYDGQASLE